MKVRTLSIAVFFLFLSCFCSAQILDKWNFGGGAGVSIPTDRAGKRLNTGWNINLRGGYNLASFLATDLDFTYQHSRLNDATLAEFNEPDGTSSMWSLTFNPVVKFARPSAKLVPYATAGYGLYHRDLTLTQPTTATELVCDPFLGFCFPATVGVNQVVASYDTYKAGWNGGGGLDFGLGDHRAKLFVEARYHRMFTSHGADFTEIPVTIGIHF